MTGATPSLLHLFDRQVATRPDVVAVCDEHGELSYRQLDEESRRLASRLVSREIRAASVGLLLDRSNSVVVAALGVLRAGRAYLPLDLSQPANRIEAILRDARTTTVVTTGDLADRLAGTAVAPLLLDEASDSCPVVDLPQVHPDDLAYLIYTSGSTGMPKGVMVEHRHVIHLIEATDQIFDLSADDTWALFHSYAFDASVWEMWGALAHGARIVVVPYWTSRTPDAFLQLLERERVTVIAQTPSAFQALIRSDMAAGSGAQLALRYVHVGGEKLDFGVLRPWFAARGDTGPKIYNMYGPTETTVYATYRQVVAVDVDLEASIIGAGLPGVALAILDPQGRQVPDGETGELYIGGPTVSRGYADRAELTAERFPQRDGGRWYRTGDLVRRRADGEIEYDGRLDSQVQVRGFRVELGEVEAKLRTHADVIDCAVAGHLDIAGTTTLSAYIVTATGISADAGRLAVGLRDHLAQWLPNYMIPSSFTVVASLPLNQNGKLDRLALRNPAHDAATAERSAPANKVEAALCECWAEALGLLEVAPDNDVFLIGGHSIIAAQVAVRMRDYGYTIPLRLLLEHRSVRAAADQLLAGGAE